MVVEYLEKIRDSFIEERLEISSSLNEILKVQKENQEFMRVLEMNEDPNFEAFSPREINSFHKRKMEEIRKSLEINKMEIENLSSQLQSVDEKLEEIKEIISVARKNYC